MASKAEFRRQLEEAAGYDHRFAKKAGIPRRIVRQFEDRPEVQPTKVREQRKAK